ncbi:GNAT family N-acetyltransferase [Streptomyces lancefieldiae]|uniref:GNAT family N-acetyltransferase n=1 Tax=Streptomyces lancefieldiae TaxID=3075520 RepID=A0ABU3AKU1_9ACTN|nr:GNAT family N-acetyltransferase [Streptomyces sp. DSM 40712]MDT0610806.1 GNAT family N-acetyltransferase [Streptomyces sp. DSM 40712]
MTSEHHPVAATTPRVGGADDDLEKRLDDELTAFNTAAADGARTEPLTVRVTDEAGTLVGGLTAWTWGTLASVDMLWVREEQRGAGWGSRLMRAAEDEAVRRGCTDMIVSTYTFQAPGFHPRLGHRERGRVEGVPGGHEDVYFHKRIGAGGAGRVLGA